MRRLALLLAFVAPAAWGLTPACTLYVDAISGSDTTPFDSAAKASNDLQAALDLWTANDIICVDLDHVETHTSDTTWTAPGDTGTDTVPIYSVDFSASEVYAIQTTTAQIVHNTAGSFNWEFNSKVYGMYFETSGEFHIGDLNNTTVEFHDVTLEATGRYTDLYTAQQPNRGFSWYGGEWKPTNAFKDGVIRLGASGTLIQGVTFSGGTAASGLFIPWGSATGRGLTCDGCNLSAMTSETLVDMSVAPTGGPWEIWFINSEFPDTVTIHDSGFSGDGQEVHVLYTDDTSAAGYRHEVYGLRGDVKINTAVYVTAGIALTEGSTNASIEMVANANTHPWAPLCSWPLEAWVNSTGSTTFDLEVLASQTMHEGELWMEVGYLGTTSRTLFTWDNVGGDIGGTTALTAGTGLANWTGEAGTETSYKLTKTYTVNKAGLYTARVCLGDASQTVDVDITVTVS